MASLIVTIRQSEGGGTYEFEPQDDGKIIERIVWYVTETGSLQLRRRLWDHDKEIWGQPVPFREFANGVWADVEVVE